MLSHFYVVEQVELGETSTTDQERNLKSRKSVFKYFEPKVHWQIFIKSVQLKKRPIDISKVTYHLELFVPVKS